MPNPRPTPPPSMDSQFVSERVSTRPFAVSGIQDKKQDIGNPFLVLPKDRIGVE